MYNTPIKVLSVCVCVCVGGPGSIFGQIQHPVYRVPHSLGTKDKEQFLKVRNFVVILSDKIISKIDVLYTYFKKMFVFYIPEVKLCRHASKTIR